MEILIFAAIGSICTISFFIFAMYEKGIKLGDWYWYCPGDGSVRKRSYWTGMSIMAVVGALLGLFVWAMVMVNPNTPI